MSYANVFEKGKKIPTTENQMVGFYCVAPPRLEREFKV
jgi:hypothetical protein